MGYAWAPVRIKRFNGLDLKTNVIDVRNGKSLSCENVYQNGSGKTSLRHGNEVMFAADEAGTVANNGVGSCTLSGTKYYFKFSNGKFSYSTSITGTVTVISPSPAISTSNAIWFAVLDDKLFFVDGTNVLRYFNGTAISASTIYTRPTVAPTSASGAGAFTYVYTVDNGLGESPSSPLIGSKISAATITVQGNTGPQTLVAGDVVRVYSRADTIAAASKLVASFTWDAAAIAAGFKDIVTVAISDTQTQLYSELGLALNKTAVTGLTGITAHYGRLVGWKGSRVYNSKSTNPHSWPDDSAQKEAFVYGFGLGDGEDITVCISFKEDLFVLKPTNGAVFGGIGPDDTGNGAYSFRRLQTNGKGCIAGKSAVVIGEEENIFLVWLSRYGFMGTDGGRPSIIGEEIETQIQGTSDSNLSPSVAYYDKKMGFYVCFVGASNSKTGWVLDVRPEIGEDGSEGRIGWFKFTNINATSVFYDSDRTLYGFASGVCVSERVSGTVSDLSDVKQEYVATGAVDTTAETITVSQSYTTGDAVVIRSSGGVPAGLVANTTYYVIRVSATVIKLATSAANALLGTAIDLTTQGSGTHSIIGSQVIPNSYTTNWIHGGAPGQTKKLGAPTFVLNATAQSVNMTISMAYDYVNTFFDDITISIGSTDIWGAQAFGVSPWGTGATAGPKRIGIPRRKVKAIRYKFSVSTINQDFELQGLEQPMAPIRSRGGYS